MVTLFGLNGSRQNPDDYIDTELELARMRRETLTLSLQKLAEERKIKVQEEIAEQAEIAPSVPFIRKVT